MIFSRGSLGLFVHPKHQNYMATSDHKESAGQVDTIISVEHKGKPRHCVHSTPNHKIPAVEITLEIFGEHLTESFWIKIFMRHVPSQPKQMVGGGGVMCLSLHWSPNM